MFKKIHIQLITCFLLLSGSVWAQTGIGTTSPASKLHIKSNGTILRLEGSDHAYLELYPQGATTRYAYFGYPGVASTQLTIMNQFSTGAIAWGTNNISRVFLTSSGQLAVGTSVGVSTLTVGSADGSVNGEITINPAFTSNEGGQINIKKSVNGSTADWVIDQYGTSASDARFRIFNSLGEGNGITILENGNVGMGNLTPTVRLQVNGDIIANSIAGSSDARFKTNVSAIANPLEKVLQLRGVNFDWNQSQFPERAFSSKRALGFIAQEVEKVLPEVVETEKSADGYKAVKYDKVVALLVEAIKEQQKQINRLQKQVKQLKKKSN